MADYYDDVYGGVSYSEGLLSDLVASAAVRRLQNVSQAGASSFVRAGRTNTRFEHSMGVMTLTTLLGGNEMEAAAGLLQDVSHTAFSHTIDYVFDDRSEGFHERIFHEVVEESDIPAVLSRYDLTWQQLFAPENLQRVDASAPLICADRIDYTLRDLVRLGYIAASQARRIVRSLTFVDGCVAFVDAAVAQTFVEWYAYLVGDVFMNPLELYVHDQFAKLIREALKLNVLVDNDLLTTDDMVISKLLTDEKYGLDSWLARIRRTRSVTVGDEARGVRVYSKGRKIDPPVLRNAALVPLSQINPTTLAMWSKIDSVASEGILVSSSE